MRPTLLHALLAACAFCAIDAHAQTPASPNAHEAKPADESKLAMNLGAFEASGARLGMSLPLALEAISSTKPAWAAAIAAQSKEASTECSSGRGVLILQAADGRPAAAIDARCQYDASAKAPIVREIFIKTRLSPALTVAQVRQALTERYGPATTDRADAGGGFEMVWVAPHSQDPSAPQAETLSADLEAHGVEAVPTALTLKLSATLPKPGSPQGAAKPAALDTLPF